MTATATKQGLVLVIVCLIRVVIMLDTTALNVAIPAITTDLSASIAQSQWIVTAYSLMLAGWLLTTGSLTDRFGPKRTLLCGLVLFGGGSLFGAFAGTAVQLIAARSVMGVGAALLMPATFAVQMLVFDEKSRAKVVSLAWGASAIAMAAGPLFGGVLLAHFWWGAVLLVNVPIGLVAAAGVRWLVPGPGEARGKRPDIGGALLSVAAGVGAVFAVISAGEQGWASPRVLVPLAVAVVAAGVFLWWERRHPAPMLDLGLFRDRRVTAAMTEGILGQFGLGGSVFLFTLYLQFVVGYTPLEAGLRVAPMALVVLVCVPLASGLITRLGPANALLAGLLVLGAGLAVLSTAEPAGSYARILAGLVLAGAGISLGMPASANVLMDGIPAARAGTAGGLTSTMQELGNSLGVAVLGSLLAAHLSRVLAGSLPPGTGHSVSAALQAGRESPHAAELVPLVQRTFVEGMATAIQVGAAVVVLAGIACRVLVGRAARTTT
ncbi:MFS transporter [Amycolatopsis sp. H6(2020)]|nr:MFS transporter [Amycolatopsis sp. H6(2020)]